LTQLDLLGKLRTQLGSRDGLGYGWTKEAYGPRLRTDPNFLGASVKVEGLFLLDFRFRIAWGKHLDADFRRGGKTDLVAKLSHALRRGPCYIVILLLVCVGS